MKIERGRNHKRPPKLIGFPKHEHYYVPGRTGDKCVTVFHDLRRGISSYNNEKGEFIEVPTRQIQKRLFPQGRAALRRVRPSAGAIWAGKTWPERRGRKDVAGMTWPG